METPPLTCRSSSLLELGQQPLPDLVAEVELHDAQGVVIPRRLREAFAHGPAKLSKILSTSGNRRSQSAARDPGNAFKDDSLLRSQQPKDGVQGP